MNRVRVRFTKHGKVRFVSHRDVARVWERTLRRIELPVAYSGGFSPRPRLHFGLALSVGHESFAEYLDIDLRDEIDASGVDGLVERFDEALPTGIGCTAAALVADDDRLSLQEAVTSCTWTLGLDGGSGPEAAESVAALLAADTLITTRERKGKAVSDDIRPYVRSLHLDHAECGSTDCATGVMVVADIGTHPRALRPAELIAALGPQWRERRVCRLAQWIDHDDRRREPLPAADGAKPWERINACAT